MAVRKVLRMGHPLLREKAKELAPNEIQTEETKQLIADMLETMHEQEGIGLAAPQIGVSKQLAIIGIPGENSRYPQAQESDLIVVINPKISVLDEATQSHWEGCLSVPGLRGEVARPRKIKVDFLDQNAQHQSLELEGFLSTVFQHEIDHLFGTLYIDRITDTTKLAYVEEFIQFWSEDHEKV